MIIKKSILLLIIFFTVIMTCVCGGDEQADDFSKSDYKVKRNDGNAMPNNVPADTSNYSNNDTESEAESPVEDNYSFSLFPAAIPVLSLEDAEQANIVAIKHYEIFKKKLEEAEAKEREITDLIGGSLDRLGYHRILNETFSKYDKISIQHKFEKIIEENGYNLSEFKQRLFPKQFSPDIASLPHNASFGQGKEGFDIKSRDGSFRFDAPCYDSMANSFLFELTVANPSEKDDCLLQLDSKFFGLAQSGCSSLQKETIHPGETKTLLGFVDVYDNSSQVTPSIVVKGEATIKEFNIYRKDYSEFTILEGEIMERSALPKPEDTDYENCRFTARFRGNAILSGLPCNKELSLSIDGFKNKKVLGTNTLKPGSKIRCTIIPFEHVPEKMATIQEVDDLSLFELENYLAVSISSISSFRSIPSLEQIGFKSEVFNYKSVFENAVNEKIPDKIKKAQKERIEKDLIAATTMLEDYKKNRDDIEKRFQNAWTKEKEKFPDGYNSVKNGVWRNINGSFWSLPKNYTFIPEELKRFPQSKLDALVALKEFLEFNGIQLIFSFVPNWNDISCRVINKDFFNIPVYQAAMFTKQLSEAGIECPYIPTTILRNYDKFSLAYLYPEDSHPGSTVQYSISDVMAERLKDYHFPQPLDPDKFNHRQIVTYGGARPYHSWPENCDIGDHETGDLFTADQILYEDKPITPDKESEILIIGNSSIQFPMDNPDAFQAFLAERMRYRVDNLRVSAAGPFTTIIQRIFDNPEFYLRGKKVVILQTMDHIILEDTIPWNNIKKMDEQRMMLNGKRLFASFSITGNGKWGNDISHEETRKRWESFSEKQDIKCLDNSEFEICNKQIDNLDLSKPVLCVIQTVRSSIYQTPQCIVNGLSQDIPAGFYVTELSWQNIYFELPKGTDTIIISVRGKKGTIMGFNQVFIYQ